MKVKTVSLLAVTVVTSFMALHTPSAVAQRRNGTFVGNPQPQPRPIPNNTAILPMSNPVAPMGNPVAPIVTSPYMRYSDGTPTVVLPGQSRTSGRGDHGRGGRDVVYVPVAVPYNGYSYYGAYYDPSASLDPEPVIPGQLPRTNVSNNVQYAGSANFSANTYPAAAAPPEATFTSGSQVEVYSEPRMIVNEPRPDRVVVPPAIGTPRADVIARFGKPWGTITSSGQETLYFDGVTVVFGTDGRVIQTR